MNKEKNITAVIMGHHEGIMFGQSLVNFYQAVTYARERALEIEVLIVLDKPDKNTETTINASIARGDDIIILDFGDQGLVKNHIVERAQGDYIAFLDGDDFWSENWLYEAYTLAESHTSNVIVHPAYNWFFGGSQGILKKVAQDDELFDVDFLRVSNYWDALCFCKTEAFKEIPYCIRDVEAGFAYEDWHWNVETIINGYKHIVAEETIHFKRRRRESQTMKASERKALMRDSKFFKYS